jgi:hypothetical protein
LRQGLPLGKAKPKACLLWPLSFSAGDGFLSLAGDALSFRCVSRRKNRVRHLSPALAEAIGLVYGENARAQLELKAGMGFRHAIFLLRK